MPHSILVIVSGFAMPYACHQDIISSDGRCDGTVLRDVCDDAFPGMELVLPDRTKHTSLPDTGIVVQAEQVQLGRGLGCGIADNMLVCLKNGSSQIVSIETQTMDITNTYRKQLLAYKRRTRDGECVDVPCSQHGVNAANVRKRLADQLVRKSRKLEVLGDHYRGMYFVTLEPVWSYFEETIGSMKPVAAGFCGTVLTVMTYRLGAGVVNGGQRGIVHCRTVKIDLEEFADLIAKGGVLPDRDEVIEQIETAVGKSIGNVATKRAAHRAVINYLGSDMAGSLDKKPKKRCAGRAGKAKAARTKRPTPLRGNVRKMKGSN